MASQSILRNGMSLQSSLTMMQKSGTTRSILKRPVPLPLSPVAQNASFSVLLSPTQKALKSAHVHFPPSPTQIAATYVTHGPNSYDRGPISISPNPVTLPGWGERVYSPSLEGFRLTAVPKAFRTLSYQASPVITEFEDPRSPQFPPPVACAAGKENRNSSIRFAPFSSVQPPARSSRPGLEKALSSYPRSPYPSAPVTPTKAALDADAEMETRGRQWPRNRDANDNITILSGPARTRARAASLEERQNKRNKKGLTLNNNGRSAHVPNVIHNAAVTPGPSPLGRDIFSPAVATLNRPNKPAPLAMDSLSQAFWQAVTLEETTSSAVASIEEPMVTALEYPESAVEYEEKLDMTLRSAAQPPLMYAAADGALWSPALPVPGKKVEKIRESLMSPGVHKSFEARVVRRDFTAPSPNDPLAAFPSFSTALNMGGDAIRYPPKAALMV